MPLLGVLQAFLDKVLRNLVKIHGLSLAQTPPEAPGTPKDFQSMACPHSFSACVSAEQPQPQHGLGTRHCKDPLVPLPAIPEWVCSKVHPALTPFQQFGCPGNCGLGVSQSERQQTAGMCTGCFSAGFLSLWLSLQAQVPFPSWHHNISAPAAPPGLPPGTACERSRLGLLTALISSWRAIFGALLGL